MATSRRVLGLGRSVLASQAGFGSASRLVLAGWLASAGFRLGFGLDFGWISASGFHSLGFWLDLA